MSYLTALQSAAAQAQTVLTQLAGDDTAGFTIAGDSTTYYGVMEEIENLLPTTGAGLEKIRLLTISATAAQFSTAPTAATRAKLTARGTTWVIDQVKPGPLHYHFHCVAGT